MHQKFSGWEILLCLKDVGERGILAGPHALKIGLRQQQSSATAAMRQSSPHDSCMSASDLASEVPKLCLEVICCVQRTIHSCHIVFFVAPVVEAQHHLDLCHMPTATLILDNK